jgi:hypothetical protein
MMTINSVLSRGAGARKGNLCDFMSALQLLYELVEITVGCGLGSSAEDSIARSAIAAGDYGDRN